MVSRHSDKVISARSIRAKPIATSSSYSRAPGLICREKAPRMGSEWCKSCLVDMKMELKWGEYLGREDCPYARRWAISPGLFSVRVHHFYSSDDPRYKHDHPWWYLTIILKGGYWDRGDKDVLLKAPAIAFRKAESAHWVDPLPGGVWTLVVTGRHKRVWGFHVKGKFKKAYRYFFDYGHPPCE